MSKAEDAVAPDLAGKAVGLLGAALPGLYLLLTSTTRLIPEIWPYDAKRMLEFALLLVLLLLAASVRSIRDELGVVVASIPRWIQLALLALLGWGAVSALVNAQAPMQLANSLSEVALFACLGLGVLVLAACRRAAGTRFDQAALGLIALTGLVVGVQELLGVAAALASAVDFNFRISLLHFSWPRFYNQVQSWTVPVLAALPLVFVRQPLARVLCVVVLGLHWYIILMTGARGSFVALTAAMVFALLFLPATRRPLIQWQLAGAVLGALVFAAVALAFQEQRVEAVAAPVESRANAERTEGFYGNEDEDTSGFLAQSVGRPLTNPMGRSWMWKTALGFAREHPVFGIGPMGYACTSRVSLGHPHNFPLQLAAEWGIPAALSALLLFAWIGMSAAIGLRRDSLSGERTEAVLPSLLLTGVIAAALHACVSGIMVMPASQVAGLLVGGWLLGLRADSAPTGVRAAWMLLPGVILATLLLGLGTHELRTMETRAAQLAPSDSMWPRLWQDSRVCQLYTLTPEATAGGVNN